MNTDQLALVLLMVSCYIGSVYEVDKNSGGAVTRTLTCYPAGGAMRIDGTVYYVLKDRLGSAYATMDASGNPSLRSGQALWVKCALCQR